MNWPSHTDYQDAMQNPSVCFAEPELKAGEARVDMLGLPRVMSGNFASVYELKCGDHRWAIRCFVRQVPGQQGRYARLSQHLNSLTLPCLVGFEYMNKGFLVKGEWYPMVKMQWVDGSPLNTWVEDNLSNPQALLKLAEDWRAMMKDLATHKLAHGDLQHGNIMVTPQNELRLVDYDGMYAPVFGRGRAPELGHINFQHPRRTADFYQEDLDNFSSLIIYTSLRALAVEPDLWQKYYTVDNLVFTSADLKNPLNSPIFQYLKGNKDAAVPPLTALLEKCCLAPVEQVPDFLTVMEALDKGTLESLPMKTPSAAPSITFSRPAPPTPAAAPVEGQAAPGPAMSRPAPLAMSRPAPDPAVAASATPPPSAAGKNVSRSAYSNVPTVATEPLKTARTPVPQAPRPSYVPPQEKSGMPWWVWGVVGVIIAALIVVILIANRPETTSENEPPARTAAREKTAPEPAPDPANTSATSGQIKPGTAVKLTPLGSMKAHSGSVDVLAFSADGKMLASAGSDKSVKLWEAQTGTLLRSMTGPEESLASVAILSDGKTLCGIASDNTIYFWDGSSGQVQRKLEDFKNNLFTVAVSPDGHSIAAGASNDRKTVRILDTFLGSAKKTLGGHSSWVRTVKFSPDGKLAAVICHDDTVNVWDVVAGKQLQSLSSPGNGDVVAISPDNRFIAAASESREIKVWDVSTGALRQTLSGHTAEIKGCAFSNDGKLLASGGTDKTLKLWDTGSGAEKQTISNFGNGVASLIFSPAGAILAVGSADQTIKLFEISQ